MSKTKTAVYNTKHTRTHTPKLLYGDDNWVLGWRLEKYCKQRIKYLLKLLIAKRLKKKI